ncbi:MAG: heavy-metal-associated domain-containing protein [Clostridium sp.]
MKSILKIYDIKNSKDISNIQKAISFNEGVIACEISKEKKEVTVVYNEQYLSIESIIDSIESLGYMII